VHYPWGSVSSLLINSKGKRSSIQSKTTGIGYGPGAWNLEWVVDQHLDRADDEQIQLQHDFEAVLRQSKQASERKYDQKHILYVNEQLDTARRTIWALLR
jgi:hypothetical protein